MDKEEEIDESVEVKEGTTQDTAHEHYFTQGDVHGKLKDVYCIECGAGHQISSDIKIMEGVIKWSKK